MEALSAGSASATADLQDPGPGLAPEPMLRPDPFSARDPWSAPEVYPVSDLTVPVYLGPTPGFAPRLQAPAPPAGLAPVPGPAGSVKNGPPSTQEPPAPLPAVAGPSPLPQNGTDDVASPRPSPDGQKPTAVPTAVPSVWKPSVPASNLPKTPVIEPGLPKTPTPAPGVSVRSAGGLTQRPSSLEVAASSAVETLQNAAASLTADVSGVLDVGESSPEDPSAGTEGSAGETTPRPASPSAPAGGSSFSVSGGGQASPGGSVVPLLLCVLASGLILLRRDGPLSWATCELPKPSSALLLPPERPG